MEEKYISSRSEISCGWHCIKLVNTNKDIWWAALRERWILTCGGARGRLTIEHFYI